MKIFVISILTDWHLYNRYIILDFALASDVLAMIAMKKIHTENCYSFFLFAFREPLRQTALIFFVNEGGM